MIHTEYDAQTFADTMILLLGTAVAAVYGLLMLIGLILRFFQSCRVLYMSFALSALASLPLLWVVGTQWSVLPRHWDQGGAGPVILFLLNVVPLCFIWTAPAIQYWLLRQKIPDGPAAVAEFEGR